MSDYDRISHPSEFLQQRLSAEAGLSSSSRLHEHFVQIDAVTPGEYQQRGAGLLIRHGVAATPFGDIFVALTPRGICKAAFLMPEARGEDASDSATRPESPALQALQAEWPGARFEADVPMAQALVLRLFEAAPDPTRPFTLHIHGTDFQLSVWRALLRIPPGSTTHYSAVAAAAGKPAAARATGSAIGANPVAVLIPCHRVIQQSGALGGYRWGPTRKLAIQAWERL
jgi:AraC family transcriptional regulator of adaptative response/methylated-DNA-[protein]-cysteine methyltransferase